MNKWFVQSINMSSWKRTIFFDICITKNRNGYRSTTPTGTRRSRNIVDIVLCKTWQTRYNLFLNTYYFIDYDSLLYRQTFIDIHMWRNEHLGLTPDVYFGYLDKNPFFLICDYSHYSNFKYIYNLYPYYICNPNLSCVYLLHIVYSTNLLLIQCILFNVFYHISIILCFPSYLESNFNLSSLCFHL